jgi:transposase-like protein
MEKGKSAEDNIEVPEKSTKNRWLQAFNCISRRKDKM